MQEGVRRAGLGFVLVCLGGTLLAGLLLKSQPTIRDGALAFPCAQGDWTGQQYTQLCYSDLVPLYGTEHLQRGRVPFIDGCPSGSGQCDEYPVLTMFAMYVAAAPVRHVAADSGSAYAGFFLSNAIMLSLAAGVTAIGLYLVAGRRALWFALAPTLLIYGFMNWDLIAVALATAATAAFLFRRDVAAGVLLGLGASAKLYPALLVVPFVAERLRAREPDRAIHLSWAAAGAWIAVNLPFALVGPHGWTEFFRFNAQRPSDFDSLWYTGCYFLTGDAPCLSAATVNVLSAGVFVLGSSLVWFVKTRREPDVPLWTFGLPLIIVFLLTSKVYSPQYGLWLLPWFALAMPRLGRLSPFKLFVLFEVTDVAVFVTRFTWFATLSPYFEGGAPKWVFQLAVLARAAVLVTCLVAYMRQRTPQLEPHRAPALEPAGAVS
jgi:uncharacterized membrane protein